MTELRRLLDGNSDELALALLRSAGEDSPSTDSLKAAAVVLGISTGLGGSALLASGLRTAAGPGMGAAGGAVCQAAIAATPAAVAITLGAVAKQVAIGLASGLFVMGGLELALDHPFASHAAAPQKAVLSSARATPELREKHRSGAALPGPVAALVIAESANPSTPPSANDGVAPRAVRRRVAVSGAAADTAAQAAEATPSEAAAVPATVAATPEVAKPQVVALNKSLAAEVALLDRARSALLAQNAPGALRALEQYRKERQTGILDPEATVLQIQVLEKLGDRAAAARLARQFITSHPESRHVDSLRVLAAEAL